MTFNVAIDGPAGSGKSEISKLLAKRLGFKRLDSGAMFRAISYGISQKGLDVKNITSQDLEDLNLSFNSQGLVELNGEVVEDYIRSLEMGTLAAKVAKIPVVRTKIELTQWSLIKEKNYVLEGRDTTSVVAPDAKFKFYLTASLEIRAKRRLLQLQEKGDITTSFKEVLTQVEQRDKSDMKRKLSPLIKVPQAIEIDSSELSLQEVLTKILSIITQNI